MENLLGYNQPLYMLAFDHRASFVKGMFGVEGEPTAEDEQKVRDFKQIIYRGFQKAIAEGLPREQAAILVDEQFGGAILTDAKAQGFAFAVGVEKSGQKEFAFEFGDGFPDHIEKYDAPIVKALVRYNPEEDKEMNIRQLAALRTLSDYCHKSGRKLLVEPLIGATEEELAALGGDKQRYDLELRPKLEVEMVKEFQDGGVEVDIWKIEGLSLAEHYQAVAEQARSGGRSDVAVIVLGRGAGQEQVEEWLKAGRDVDGVAGFAIGRTIFWEPLEALRDGKISAQDAVDKICENYLHFYKVFTS